MAISEADPPSPSRSPTTKRRHRGRPRSDAVEKTILGVAVELLAQGGFIALNYDALAAGARCSKATIYRRWPTKGHLAVAALAELPDPEVPDRGSLRADLLEMLGGLLGIFEDSPAVAIMQSLIGERARDPEIQELLNHAFQVKRAGLAKVLDRGIARGELPGNIDRELLLDIVVGPILCRYFCTGAPVDEAFLESLIDAAFRSCSVEAG
jgi:AcrR family transcriptional regulator